ncbi:25S rRNA (adenine2142-N1)-methyltransferase [Elasticomyces elasticus]|nr:25S rRNA (adenine2142-N1)-methyltransferase [Elasticomyces elasticus]
MRNSVIASVGVLALGAIAAPNGGHSWNGWGFSGNGACMNDDQANKVAHNFESLIAAYTNDVANAVLTPGVEDYSDSVIELIDGGCPSSSPGPAAYIALGSATFDSRVDFEAGQGGQPNITFELLNVWHNCDTVTLRWRSPLPNPGPAPPPPAVQEQVTGIVVLETTFNGWQANQQFLINTIYSEFNSGAWLYDLGVFTPDCTATATKRTRSLPNYFARL